jgi:hypothetical protein
VKLAFETSKKTFATASTLTRAVVVSVAGRVTSSVPSFAVLAASTSGYVWPPSEESAMLTFAVETGGRSVLALFQVTVCCEPGGYVTAVSGEVTRNGPAVGASVRVTSPKLLPPPPVCRSRAVALKCSVGDV